MTHVIVIGSGAAGAALAYRLSCSPENTVMLLEAGEDVRPAQVSRPELWPTALGGEIDFRYKTVAQPGIDGRVIDYPRGRILGGTTCLNAMIHMRPADSDTATWGSAWAAEEISPYLTAMEAHRTHGTTASRGNSGPVPNGTVDVANPICAAFVDACVERGYSRLADVNSPRVSGTGWYDLSIDGAGSRADAAQSYLRPHLNRPNLQLLTGWTATHLDLDTTGRVVSVIGTRHGLEESIDVPGEIVLSAGAIDTPALLLRSGVGPASALREVGIDPLLDLAGVGRNLQDHPALPVVWATRTELPPPTTQYFESVLSLYRHDQLDGRSALASFGHLAYLPPDMPSPAHGATALIGLLDPRSRGTVSLEPAQPMGPPVIDPALLTDDSDVDTLIQAVQIIRELHDTAALTPFGLEELLPGDSLGADLAAFVRQATGTYFHPVGTCRMGRDPLAVVDHELRVHGTRNLRVADASIMPSIPTAATSVLTQAIGWRAASLIDTALELHSVEV